MKVFTVQTLESFMSLQYGLPEMDFFRGQSSSEYKLILLYDEAVDLLEGIAQLGEVICVDLVEVSPPYDDAAGTTCYLAARILADFLGFITKERERRGER